MIKGTDYIGVTISALVYHPEKGLLLGHRTDQCRDERWKWDNWGGGLEFGETIREGIKRELVEEFGREFSDDQIYNLGYREQFREHEGRQTHRVAFYHLIILAGNEELVNMEPHKHDEMKFFPLDALPSRQESHSVFYPTLGEFKETIEGLIGKEIDITS